MCGCKSKGSGCDVVGVCSKEAWDSDWLVISMDVSSCATNEDVGSSGYSPKSTVGGVAGFFLFLFFLVGRLVCFGGCRTLVKWSAL